MCDIHIKSLLATNVLPLNPNNPWGIYGEQSFDEFSDHYIGVNSLDNYILSYVFII